MPIAVMCVPSASGIQWMRVGWAVVRLVSRAPELSDLRLEPQVEFSLDVESGLCIACASPVDVSARREYAAPYISTV
jgi:hypothetical protein